MDLVTPAVSIQPGRVVASLNYEPVASGYRRLRGYERFDGQVSPSVQTFYRVNFTTGTSEPTLGGGINLSNKSILISLSVTSGTWGAGTAAGYMILAVSGDAPNTSTDYTASNITRWPSGTQIAVASGSYSLVADPSPYLAAAPGLIRPNILAVPGSGPIRGVWAIGSHVFAFRNNAGGTEGKLYVASEAGWTSVGTGRRLGFTAGTGTNTFGVVGATLFGPTGAGSPNAIVAVFVVESGALADGDAAGYFILTSQTGSFSAGTVTIPAISASFTVAGNSAAAYTIPAGGRYKFITHNFYGQENQERSYGVNGVGPGFEFGDSYIAPIATGRADDTPHCVAAYKNELALGYHGGSVQISQPGEPFGWNGSLGAAEIAVGDDLVDFLVVPNALAILGVNSIAALTGNDSADFVLDVLNRNAGALEHTANRIAKGLYVDNVGFRTLTASQDFGNFRQGTLSQAITPLLEDLHLDDVAPVACTVVRQRDQYWLFYSNQSGIVAQLGKKYPEFLPFRLGFQPSCSCSPELGNNERMFIGSDAGFVYEFDKGTSFDGAVIEHYIRLPFNHLGSPQVDKRAHKVLLDLEASGTTTLSVAVDFNYGASLGLDAEQLVVTTGAGALDDLGSNELYFASQIETVAERYIDGVAKNFSLKISGSTSTEQPHTITGVTYLISPRRLVR